MIIHELYKMILTLLPSSSSIYAALFKSLLNWQLRWENGGGAGSQNDDNWWHGGRGGTADHSAAVPWTQPAPADHFFVNGKFKFHRLESASAMIRVHGFPSDVEGQGVWAHLCDDVRSLLKKGSWPFGKFGLLFFKPKNPKLKLKYVFFLLVLSQILVLLFNTSILRVFGKNFFFRDT